VKNRKKCLENMCRLFWIGVDLAFLVIEAYGLDRSFFLRARFQADAKLNSDNPLEFFTG
jgi:hypothetical protein